jgi:hypothetical protein
MAEFNVRSDNVDVERIMQQIRERIREKRGVDYTEEQIRELAGVKLEKFLDPRNVRSELVQQFREQSAGPARPAPDNYAFEDVTIYDSIRAPIRWVRRLVNPLLKLFFNPNPIIGVLNQQSRINAYLFWATDPSRLRDRELLTYEVLNNLVVELTRTTIEVKNLRMRLESMSTRLDFDERRARVLEGSVMYRPEATTPPAPGDDAADEEARRRRRRRRGRKRGPAGPGEPEAPGEHGASRDDARPEEPPRRQSGTPATGPGGGPATGGSSGSSDEP